MIDCRKGGLTEARAARDALSAEPGRYRLAVPHASR